MRKNIIFDGTVLNYLQDCAYKFYLTQEMDLRPINGLSDAIEEGDLLHNMFELYNLLFKDYRIEILYEDKYQATINACEDYGQFVATNSNYNITQVECDTVIYQFKSWTDYQKTDGVEILEVEKPFIKELYKDEDIGIYYTGKIDRYTNTPNFGIVPRDYKKASQRKEPEHLSNQFTGYCYATDSDIIIVDKVGFQKTLPPEDRFQSYPLYYNEHQKKVWREDTIWWGRMYAFYIETGTWPRNRTSCDKYAGCIMRPICDSISDEQKQYIIKTQYVISDHWDPTTVLISSDTIVSEKHIKMIEYAKKWGFNLKLGKQNGK